MEQPKLDIGKNLRKFRDAKKLTQGEYAIVIQINDEILYEYTF